MDQEVNRPCDKPVGPQAEPEGVQDGHHGQKNDGQQPILSQPATGISHPPPPHLRGLPKHLREEWIVPSQKDLR